jgi:hypothetical protein
MKTSCPSRLSSFGGRGCAGLPSRLGFGTLGNTRTTLGYRPAQMIAFTRGRAPALVLYHLPPYRSCSRRPVRPPRPRRPPPPPPPARHPGGRHSHSSCVEAGGLRAISVEFMLCGSRGAACNATTCPGRLPGSYHRLADRLQPSFRRTPPCWSAGSRSRPAARRTGASTVRSSALRWARGSAPCSTRARRPSPWRWPSPRTP